LSDPVLPPHTAPVGPLEVFTRLIERRRTVVLLPVLVGALTYGGTFLLNKEYTAVAQVLPPSQSGGAGALLSSLSGALGGLGGALAGGLGGGGGGSIDQWIGVMSSRTIADQVIDRFKLMAVYEAERRIDAVDQLKGQTKFSTDKTGLIRIEVDDVDPQRAADIANAYVELLQVLSERFDRADAAARRGFIEERLNKVRSDLTAAEAALKAEGVNVSSVKTSPEAAVGVVAQLAASVAAQEVKVATLSGSMTPGNATLQTELATLTELRRQLAEAQRNSKADGGGNYTGRFRDYKYQEALFEALAKQYELAKFEESSARTVFKVVDPAQPPEKQSKPRRVLIAGTAGLAAGLLATLWVLLGYAWRVRQTDPEFAAALARMRSGVRGRVGR
jgi:tyrosine-protein kinase Etk/Wzc